MFCETTVFHGIGVCHAITAGGRPRHRPNSMSAFRAEPANGTQMVQMADHDAMEDSDCSVPFPRAAHRRARFPAAQEKGASPAAVGHQPDDDGVCFPCGNAGRENGRIVAGRLDRTQGAGSRLPSAAAAMGRRSARCPFSWISPSTTGTGPTIRSTSFGGFTTCTISILICTCPPPSDSTLSKSPTLPSFVSPRFFCLASRH